MLSHWSRKSNFLCFLFLPMILQDVSCHRIALRGLSRLHCGSVPHFVANWIINCTETENFWFVMTFKTSYGTSTFWGVIKCLFMHRPKLIRAHLDKHMCSPAYCNFLSITLIYCLYWFTDVHQLIGFFSLCRVGERGGNRVFLLVSIFSVKL